MGCCKIDRSRRSLNVEIRVLDVFRFYRLLEDVDLVRLETPYGLLLLVTWQGLALRKRSVRDEIMWTLNVERVVDSGINEGSDRATRVT